MKRNLTPCEAMIMKCIFDDKESLKLPQILEKVNARFNKEWAPPTVSTFLARLVEKGFLTMERSGRSFFYTAIVSRSEFINDSVKDSLDWCAGDLIALFGTAIKQREIDSDEIGELKKLLDAV